MVNNVYKLPVVYPYACRPHTVFSITLVGCGGTGGYVAPHIARLMALRTDKIRHIAFIDSDIVERRNLDRQNFIHADLGRPKAEVLARRYSAAFGIPIRYHTEMLDDSTANLLLLTPPSLPITNVVIIVSCVDNHYTRALISDWIRRNSVNCANRKNIIWIDAGNELYSGHVSLGYIDDTSKVTLPVDSTIPSIFRLPLVTEIFPEIMDSGKERPEISCAERAQGDPQAIATNLMAATLALNYVYALVTFSPIYSHLVMFDVLNNAVETRLNTIDNLTAYMRSCSPSQPFDVEIQPLPVLEVGV